MPDLTTRLALPILQPSQAQKHVTHNEALRLLDALVQPVALALGPTPPAAPNEGEMHLVGLGATGAWAGKGGAIAIWTDTVWQFHMPAEGWRVHLLSSGAEAVWSGTEWLSPRALPLEAARLGIAAEADDTNRLSVSAAATLLNHAGSDHRLKINKNTADATASLLFQSAFSGRAEMGLAGRDDFSVKVSADGAAWTEALRVAGATGTVSGAAVQSDSHDATANRLMKVGAFGLGSTQPAKIAATGNLNAPIGGPTATYAVENTPANAPLAQGVLLHLAGQDSSSAQLLVSRGTGTAQAFIRANAATAQTSPGAWAELLHKLNVVGSVGRANGVMTGAVIERGSNANGEYVRFADGTQICTGSVAFSSGATTAFGALYQSSSVMGWTYPATFAAAPAVTGHAVNSLYWIGSATPFLASIQVRLFSASSASTSVNANLLAVGRWF